MTLEEVQWIEAAAEAGDSPEEIADMGGYAVCEVLELLRKADHPCADLSDYHRDVLSLWASGAGVAQIALALDVTEITANTALSFLRRRHLIWPQAPGREFIRIRTGEKLDTKAMQAI
jgi:hypothetical protein